MNGLHYLEEALFHKDGVERLAGLAGDLQHGHDEVVPEDPVGRVDLGDVAEQLLGVDLGEDEVVLEVTQAVQEELEK